MSPTYETSHQEENLSHSLAKSLVQLSSAPSMTCQHRTKGTGPTLDEDSSRACPSPLAFPTSHSSPSSPPHDEELDWHIAFRKSILCT